MNDLVCVHVYENVLHINTLDNLLVILYSILCVKEKNCVMCQKNIKCVRKGHKGVRGVSISYALHLKIFS